MSNQANPSTSLLVRNFAEVRSQIAEYANRCGRNPEEITLIAVSKTVSPETVFRVARLDAGLAHHVFGENRTDELIRKHTLCPDEEYHFIGTLQTNKVKHVIGTAALIHSVDSLRLLDVIDRQANARNLTQPVLIQVNVSGEVSKQGFAVHEAASAIAHATSLSGLVVNGLMTMAPFGAPEDARSVFNKLRVLRDELAVQFGDDVDLKHLSMGMTNDFGVAIEEGATLVRVGTALFSE